MVNMLVIPFLGIRTLSICLNLLTQIADYAFNRCEIAKMFLIYYEHTMLRNKLFEVFTVSILNLRLF